MKNSKTVCLCASSLPENIICRLSEDFRVIPLPPDTSVDAPVQCHPDMICAVMDSMIFFHESYAAAYPSVIDGLEKASGCHAVITRGKRSKDYPFDISLNAAVMTGAVICHADHTSPELIRAAAESGRRVIPVKQGYAACSTLISGDCVLTSDKGIHRTLARESIASTYISNDGIRLPGYGCGFIGGCGGVHDGSLYLFGSADTLKERDTLYSFVKDHGLSITALTDAPLTDYGGLKFL